MLDVLVLAAAVTLLVSLIAVVFVIYRDYKKSKEIFSQTVLGNEEKLPQESVEEALESEEDLIPLPPLPGEAEEESVPEAGPSEESVPQKSASETAPQETVTQIEEAETPEEPEDLIETIKRKDYGTFNGTRLVEELGLESSEVDEFITELKRQIEVTLPRIEEAIAQKDFNQVERLTHGLKGAALNVGSGGIVEVLIDYNDFVKSRTDLDVLRTYQDLVKEKLKELG